MRDVLAAKRKELKAKGKGNRPNAADRLEEDQVELLWQSGVLGDKHPRTLQNTMYYVIATGIK